MTVGRMRLINGGSSLLVIVSGSSVVRFIHEVWQNEDGDVEFLCAAWPWAEQNRRQLPPGAKVIGTFEAGSMIEARTHFYRFMGWDAYKPSEDDDFEPYPDDWAQR